jgi:hypothetical protein
MIKPLVPDCIDDSARDDRFRERRPSLVNQPGIGPVHWVGLSMGASPSMRNSPWPTPHALRRPPLRPAGRW